MHTKKEATAKMKNDLSFSSAHASTPRTFDIEIGSPFAGGVVFGRVRQYTPKIADAIAAAWKI